MVPEASTRSPFALAPASLPDPSQEQLVTGKIQSTEAPRVTAPNPVPAVPAAWHAAPRKWLMPPAPNWKPVNATITSEDAHPTTDARSLGFRELQPILPREFPAPSSSSDTGWKHWLGKLDWIVDASEAGWWEYKWSSPYIWE